MAYVDMALDAAALRTASVMCWECPEHDVERDIAKSLRTIAEVLSKPIQVEVVSKPGATHLLLDPQNPKENT